MNQKVIDTFAGELYFLNEDEIQLYVQENSKPGYEGFLIDKISLIDDADNKVQFLKGDFPNARDYYGFTIKAFLYPKDKTSLGSIKYVVEAKQPVSHINAKYKEDEAGFRIYGYLTTDGREGKEGFMLFVEKPVIQEKEQASKKSISKVSATQTKTVQMEKVPSLTKVIAKVNETLNRVEVVKKSKATKVKVKEKAVKVVESVEESIVNYFTPLDTALEKQAAIHFVSYVLMKAGYNIQQLQNKNGLPDLMLEYDDYYSFVQVYASSKRNPSWKVEVRKNQKEYYYIFCHIPQGEFIPDFYIVEGAQVARWMGRRGAVSVTDKEMQKIKNSWAPLLD